MAINATIFETALGFSALIFGSSRVLGCLLPEQDRDRIDVQLDRRYPEAGRDRAPGPVESMVADVIAMVQGQPRTVCMHRLDLSRSPPLNQRVYALAAAIPYGQTTTYGAMAKDLGDVSLARAVGRALGANPIPILIPCHRVLGADGKIGGFSGGAGVETKVRLLNVEQAQRNTPTPLLFADLPIKVPPRR